MAYTPTAEEGRICGRDRARSGTEGLHRQDAKILRLLANNAVPKHALGRFAADDEPLHALKRLQLA